jgi:iron complex transport system ATP-binding protein
VTEAIVLTGLSHAYGATGHRLTDVSLTVRTGEVSCLLGPNGAGKTTLLRCLLNLLTPQRGTIQVHGHDIARLSARQLARLVAYVPQSTTMPLPFSAFEVALMGRTPYLNMAATPGAADRDHTMAQLASLGIAHLAARRFSTLSGGERQLVLLARALVQAAPVLVLDEPTAALDYGNEVRLLATIRALAGAGRTVIMTTHQPAHALAHADRAVLMQQGRIIADGPPSEVVTSARLSDLYGVPIHVAAVALPGRTVLTCVPVPP